MRRWTIAGIAGAVGMLMLGSAAGVTPAAAEVSVNVQLGAPPQLAVIPGTPVEYAPALPANYFFYGGHYYVFTHGNWYAARGYNGPWAVVAPGYVPAPLLRVPVGYYRAAPYQWHGWQRAYPPRWAPAWGHDWRDHRGDHRHHGRGGPGDDGRRGDNGRHGDHGRPGPPNRDRR